jgi:hypothetical protein
MQLDESPRLHRQSGRCAARDVFWHGCDVPRAATVGQSAPSCEREARKADMTGAGHVQRLATRNAHAHHRERGGYRGRLLGHRPVRGIDVGLTLERGTAAHIILDLVARTFCEWQWTSAVPRLRGPRRAAAATTASTLHGCDRRDRRWRSDLPPPVWVSAGALHAARRAPAGGDPAQGCGWARIVPRGTSRFVIATRHARARRNARPGPELVHPASTEICAAACSAPTHRRFPTKRERIALALPLVAF